MNRTFYFNSIESSLNMLAYRIETLGKLNLLNLNIHSETFFADLCNILFDLKFINMNGFCQNCEGIDLKDDDNKVLAQVSSICTREKIENSLNKEIYKDYIDYSFKFISISKKVSDSLKKSKLKNPYGLNFDPTEDILDVAGILRKVLNSSIDKQKVLYNFIQKELGENTSVEKFDSNISKVINILSKEKIEPIIDPIDTKDFKIEEKIDYNNLRGVKGIIDDYKIFYNRLDKIYKEFDKEGWNKSFSILQKVKRKYLKLKNIEKSSEVIFYEIISELIMDVQNSKNYEELPIEELEMCVDILVVDAFIRCKIFEKPKGL